MVGTESGEIHPNDLTLSVKSAAREGFLLSSTS